MKLISIISLTLTLIVPGFYLYADEDITDRIQAARKFHESEQARADRESMRDKSHDNRFRIDKDTSAGASVDRDHKTGETRGEINIKLTH